MFFTIMKYCGVFGIPGVILLSILGIRKNEGLWGNVITAINVTFAALIATNYWEDLASLLAGKVLAKGLFYWDYISIWVIFLLAYLILDEITRRISRIKVKFPETLDLVGGPASGLVLFAVFFLFYSFTLHLAPLNTPTESGFAQYDLLRGKSYDLLSDGNLAPFANSNRFNSQRTLQNHNVRRTVITEQVNTSGATGYEGNVPPRSR